MTRPADAPANDDPIEIRPADPATDRAWLAAFRTRHWGGDTVVSRGIAHRLDALPAFVAWAGGEPVGEASYHLSGDDCELTSIACDRPGIGCGKALLAAVEAAARAAGARRVWLITTNDNLDALRFYQRRGYRIAAVYPGAVDEARQQKPAIPLVGNYGIPLRDEIVLEKALG